VADAARSRLPFTGASTVVLGSTGGLLLGVGLLLLLWRRRRPALG
jgi:LPXTG-motif cell wall-anchored protein